MAAERHPLTDQVLVVLKRAWPAEVEKDDLIEQAGLSMNDLGQVLEQLRRDGELDESGEQYAWRNPDDPERTGTTVTPGAEEEPDAGDEDLASRMQLPDHTGRHVQVSFVVDGSFAPARGSTDQAITNKAAKIAEEIGNLLGKALPTLGANVTISKVQVYDKPRVVFDAEGAEEEPD